jgi:hypothetical protein
VAKVFIFVQNETTNDNHQSGFWRSRRVCVMRQHGAGFLGSFVVDKLRQHGAKDVFVPRRADYDLVQGDAIRRLLSDARPDVLIYLAARRRPARLPRFAGSPHRGSPTTLAITRGVPSGLRAIMA